MSDDPDADPFVKDSAKESAKDAFWEKSWSLVPFVIFGLVMYLFSFEYHDPVFRMLSWIIAAFFIVGAICLTQLRSKTQEPNVLLSFYSVLGLLSVVAVVMAVLLGLFNYRRHTSVYLSYEGQRYYSNVQPTDLALAHLDAGKIDFTQGTSVARNMSAGYEKDNSMYCVAPIVDTADADNARAEFFAAWICQASGELHCNEAPPSEARRGLVYLKKRTWLLENFRQAAAKFAANFTFIVSEDALFLEMVENPDRAQLNQWRLGLYYFLCALGWYLVVSILLGIVCLRICNEPPRKRKSRLYTKP